MSDRVYCIDSSTIINFMRDQPPEFFPGLWERIAELIEDHRMYVHRQVCEELTLKGDGKCVEWKKQLPDHCIVEIDNEQAKFIARMANEHKYLANLYAQPENARKADPFLIAIGYTRGYCVVTAEGRRQWKIPDICQRYEIECIDKWRLMQLENWSFR